MVDFHYLPWLVWLTPIVASVLVPLVSGISERARNVFVVGVGFLTAAFAAMLIPSVIGGNSYVLKAEWTRVEYLNFAFGVRVDPISVFMANIAGGIGALILLYSLGYMAHEEDQDRYYYFMLLFIGAMIALVMADNFLQLYIFWEIVGLCSYALIGFWYKRPEAVRAGIKAFIVTRAGDVALLIGIILLYLQVGSFDYSALNSAKISPGLASLIAILMFIGAIGKSAQLPLHVWLPDAMEGPTTVSALIHAATMVKAGVYLVARMQTINLGLDPLTLDVILWIGGLTALLAATMALVSVDIKRVLAYSTVSNIGYMMTVLGAAGLFASQFHLMSHAVFKALLFLSAGVVLHVLKTRDLRNMGGLRKHMPITFSACLVGTLAGSGIPPFNGFWSKHLILEILAEKGVHILALFLLTSMVTVVYSFRLLYLAFFGEKSEYAKLVEIKEGPWVMTVPLVLLAIGSAITGFLEAPFAEFMGIHKSISIAELLSPVSLASYLVLAIGLAAVYVFFFGRIVHPENLRKGIGAKIQKLLENGYYFDHLYDRLFVRPSLFAWDKIKKLQTGVLGFNMLAVSTGLIALILVVYSLW